MPPTARRFARALSPALLVTLLACASAPSAQAAPQLEWSKVPASLPSPATPTGVSCASEALCVAVDEQGDALITSDPAAPAASWEATSIDKGSEGPPLSAVSCAPGGPCVAVDRHGNAFVDQRPGASSWSHTTIEHGARLTGVSCASASLCVAVDEAGDMWSNTDSGLGVWTAARFGSEHPWSAVSCSPSTSAAPSRSVCVAVDTAGELLASEDPTGATSAWHLQKLDPQALDAISCASMSECVAVDAAGHALASSDPGSAGATWSLTPADPGETLDAVSCAISGLCAALGAHGAALASDDAAGALPEWGQQSIDSGQSLAGVSCLGGGLCVALDAAGHSLSARVPTPLATTLTPAKVTFSTATLEGLVEPRDALLDACLFEYGTVASGVYSQSIPCETLPGAIAGAQPVSATASGLDANTAYRYRLLAITAAGTATGAEQTFTTAVSASFPLVTPNPSISGTPAVGQRLTCHPNVNPPTNVTPQLTYAWVRDQIPIPSTDSTTYTVKGQDSGHHLQCQVTATDEGGSVTKKSSFVTIPAGGAPASAGETSVGAANFKGATVSVPVFCSAQASAGCQVALRLTVVETLNGRRVVAVAARAATRTRGHASGLRHTTLTLASARMHLAPGAHATIAAVLVSTGKRLLKTRRRFTANVYVAGTVIGVIQAPLAQQLLTLNAPSGHAARHARTRR
ncbi:MAG TPA: hypothetical protein VK765_03175 [Solirubrobacteraceae bacterium]|jgi:hypothetical protein|nr:hypothetical protein [Solirubrobacteraceae bacterium]